MLRCGNFRVCRVGPGSFTPSLSQNRLGHSRVIRLVPPLEGCRLPLNIGFLPLPVDPSQMAVTRSLRSTGITPFRRYYGAVRPSLAHRYFRPRSLSHVSPRTPRRGRTNDHQEEVTRYWRLDVYRENGEKVFDVLFVQNSTRCLIICSQAFVRWWS
jgi:hypothetical protein